MKTRKTPLALAIAALLAAPMASAGQDDLKSEVEALKKENQRILERLEATADMLESMQGGQGAAGSMPSGQHDHAMAGTGSLRDRTFGIHGSGGSTTVGAYGEMHYNNLKDQNSGDTKKEMDFHRFILFMGHEFTDKIRFWSELEVEHAYIKDNNDGSGSTAPGEVAIEQAFLEFDLTPDMAARAGILLIPVGFINETHEPPTFYGVERPNVDKYILPTTWREGGASLTGRFGQGFSYDVLVHTGLQVSASDNYSIRNGRMGVGGAPADNLAYTARLNWAGMPGLLLGGAVQYQTDVTQGTDPNAGAATLVSAHANWEIGKFTLPGTWSLPGSSTRSSACSPAPAPGTTRSTVTATPSTARWTSVSTTGRTRTWS